jgi:hypothetical protein
LLNDLNANDTKLTGLSWEEIRLALMLDVGANRQYVGNQV